MGSPRVTQTSEDRDLVRRWGCGDQVAAKQLIARYEPELNRFFRAQQAADADDLVQETLLALMEARDRFRGDASFRTYVLRIARYKLWSHRRLRRGPHIPWEDAEDELGIQTGQADRMQPEEDLNEALTQLPPALSRVAILSFETKLSRRAIARVLGIPAGTVASRLRSAKTQLRALLDTKDVRERLRL
jgi:RNA polymerase sigma factor (sigma-70 family)